MRKVLSFPFAVLLSVVALLVLASPAVFSQDTPGEIRGVVTEQGKTDPLIGASVLLVGTNMGGTTDIEGKYTIRRVPPGQYSVLVRYVGYKEMKKDVFITAGKTEMLDFALSVTSVQMGEVVITGQGAAIEKRRLATTVETLSSKDLAFVPVKSIDVLLQGRIPGLSSYMPGGTPGSGARIMTRGVKGALNNTTPVIYVDGVRVDVNPQGRLAPGTGGTLASSLSDLVTGEIDRVEVVKGGAAATLYGSEAANGVIQIFTKKGVPGATRWNFNATTGYDVAPMRNVWSDYTKNHFFQDGMYQGYRLAIDGGNDNLTYALAGKITENKGTVTRDLLDDRLYNLSLGLRSLISDKGSIEGSASYTRTRYGKTFNDNAIAAPLSAMEIEASFEPFYTSNPDSLLELYLKPELYETVNRWIVSTNVNYAFYPWWNNKLTIGTDYRKNEDRQFAPIEAGGVVSTPGGYLTRADREYQTTTLTYNANFTVPEIGPVSQVITVGAQAFRINDREISGTGTNFKVPGTRLFSNASVLTGAESNFEFFNYGFIFQDQVGIGRTLFLDLAARFDGTTTAGVDVPMQLYPKAGFAYNLSDEEFYPDMIKDYLSSIKIRAAYGQTGQFPPAGARDRTYAANPYLSESGLDFNNPGNHDLKPDRTTSYDLGADLGFFGDQVSLEFSYFKYVTTDASFNVTEDPAAGLGNQRRNVGEIQNDGIEVSIRAGVLDQEDIRLNVRGSYSTLKNQVTSMGGAAEFTVAGFVFAPMRVREGSPVGIVQASQPRLESDGTYHGNADIVYVGSPTPTSTASIGFDLTLFRDLSISAFAEGAFGHYILNQSLSRRIVNATATVGRPLAVYQEDYARLPVVAAGYTAYTRNTASSILVEHGDWIKVREISARYRLPREFMGGVVVTASVRNPFVLMNKATKVDPETSFIPSRTIELGGIVGATVEAPIQWRLGIDITL